MARPEWQSEVLAGVPDDVRAFAQANLDAGNALTAPDLGPPLQSLPDWTILVPKPGPMQFIPSTWAVYREGDINDDHDAIQAAARYLKAAGGPGNMDQALYAYNPSNAYVTAIQKYAGVMLADHRAFDGYHAWQVYVSTVDGTTYLPEGWHKT